MTDIKGNRAALVFGGARSGKSRFAEHLADNSGLERIYLATGAALDGEMEERIAHHRLQRGTSWTTIEEQIDIVGILKSQADPSRVILVDCLTLWLSNLLFQDADIPAETKRLTAAVSKLSGPVIFVSNEVGMGIVPENRLSRSFRDLQGRLNQDIADICSQVVFVAAGCPLLLKPSVQQEIAL